MAERLSEALCTISEKIDGYETDLDLFDTNDMQELVAKLYAHIFLFLNDVMDWMMKKRRKRLLDSFNDDLPSVFENEMEKIKHISESIRNLAAQMTRAEVRSSRLAVERMERDIRVGLEGIKREYAEMKKTAESVRREQIKASDGWAAGAQSQDRLAHMMVDMLEDRAVRWLEASWATQRRMVPFNAAISLSLDGPSVPVSQYTTEDIAMSSSHLEDYFYRDRVRLPADTFDAVMIQPDIFRHISDWARATPPRVMWMDGPPLVADDVDNPVTMMAAKVIGLAEQTQAHVISYFCELRRGEKVRAGNDTKEAQAVIFLVYALLRQLIELLPPLLETSTSLSDERFQRLDGSLGTWGLALSMFGDLLRVMPGPVLCIIDGFHWLNDRSTDEYLTDLIKALRGDKIKTLLFTTGRSVVLRDELSTSETFFMETKRSIGRGVALDRQDW